MEETCTNQASFASRADMLRVYRLTKGRMMNTALVHGGQEPPCRCLLSFHAPPQLTQQALHHVQAGVKQVVQTTFAVVQQWQRETRNVTRWTALLSPLLTDRTLVRHEKNSGTTHSWCAALNYRTRTRTRTRPLLIRFI